MKDDDTTIEDGVHELFVYKVCWLTLVTRVGVGPPCVNRSVIMYVRVVFPCAVQGDGEGGLQVHHPPLDQRPRCASDSLTRPTLPQRQPPHQNTDLLH